MRKILCVNILISVLLTACGGGDDLNDGNPNANKQSINFITSRLGTSGGFIDINVDGKSDVIIGAPEATSSSGRTGAALIYMGTDQSISNLPATTLVGENKGDYFGFSYANLGDVNDDGFADFAIGAINADGKSGISGAVYVYKGGENPPSLLLKIEGENAFDKFGYAISGGDVNGDNVNDILISSPYTFTENYQSGAVSIYFGGKNIDNEMDIVIKGEKVNASIGLAITTGDVNGDTIDDIIMDGHSKVYIYYGAKDLKQRIESDPTPDVKIRSDSGRHGGSGFGWSIAYAGDIDGDGFGDIAIGNPRRSDPSTSNNQGSFYLFKGGPNLPSEFFEDDNNQRLVKILGNQINDHFANSIAVIDDVDGRGKKDFLIGANWADSGTDEEQRITGNIYLFYGEDLLVNDPMIALNASDAEKDYPISQSSAEYGKFVVANGTSILSGTSGAEKHNGGAIVKNIATEDTENMFSTTASVAK